MEEITIADTISKRVKEIILNANYVTKMHIDIDLDVTCVPSINYSVSEYVAENLDKEKS